MQAANFLDEQAEKAGRVYHKKTVATRRWYHRILNDTRESDSIPPFYYGFFGGSIAGVLVGTVF